METKNYFSTDAAGNILPSATCYVYVAGTTDLATGLVNINGAPLSNPFTALPSGLVQFKAPDGEYDLRVTKAGRDFTIRIQCFDGIAFISDAAGLIFYDGQYLSDYLEELKSFYDYSQLEAYSGSAKVVHLTKKGINGFFARSSDMSSPGNRGTRVLGASGLAWDRIYVGSINAAWFDLPYDGVTSATSKIQSALSFLRDGDVIIPPGNYEVEDLSIVLKGQAPNKGGFSLIADGVAFSGSGVLAIDSCKRVSIKGLDAPTHDLMLRGCWYSDFSGVRMRDIVFGDKTGVQFSSNYWLSFHSSQFQSIVTSKDGTQGNNQIRWSDCQFRGDASQGFSSTRDYFIQLLANQDAQSWTFAGCDISYYLVSMLNVSPLNLEDIQIEWSGCYFDTKYPSLPSRPKTRLVTDNCQCANDMPNSVTLSQAARGSQDAWRSDRAAGFKSYSAFNLVPNGDLYDKLQSYVGANLPVLSSNGATVTPGSSSSAPNGNYININQPATSSNQVRFRPKAIPVNSRYTGVLIIRNANSGQKSLRFSFAGLFFDALVNDSEWTMVTLTTGLDLVQGSVTGDILMLTNDNTGFNVDVCYIGIFAGENPPMLLPSSRPQCIYTSTTWDPPSIASGGQSTLNIPVPGSSAGDFALVSFSNPLQGLQLTAYYIGSETFQVLLRNGTGGPVDLLSGTIRLKVEKTGY